MRASVVDSFVLSCSMTEVTHINTNIPLPEAVRVRGLIESEPMKSATTYKPSSLLPMCIYSLIWKCRNTYAGILDGHEKRYISQLA